MEFSRRRFVASALALGAVAGLPGAALAQVAGRDFQPVSPVQPTDDPAKIEVLEFFSYGCPHCADFNPLLTAWAAKLQSDVYLRKVPVSFGRVSWGNIAKLYYALEATGDLKRLDSEIFKSVQSARLFEERPMADWVEARGVDRKKFTETFASFGVMSKVRRGDQLAQAYKIGGVPALAVDGRFLVTANSFEDQLAVADKLIARVRSEKAGKK